MAKIIWILRLIPLLVWWGEHEKAREYARQLQAALTPEGLQIDLIPDWDLLSLAFTPDLIRQVPSLSPILAQISVPGQPADADLAASLQSGWVAGNIRSLSLARGIKRLLARGEKAAAEQLLHLAATHQRPDGSFPETFQASTPCLTGLLEMASAWFQAGHLQHGEQAYRAFLKSRDRKTFLKLSGKPRGLSLQVSALTFLEALRDRVVCTFEATAPRFPTEILAEDGRFRIVDDLVAKYQPQVVADIGCGKGRFIKLLQQRHPHIQAYAVDLSTTMLGELPDSIHAQAGTLLNTGLPDEVADLVFCVEALEHAVNIQAGVKELARITRPGGRLLILDKDVQKLGAMEICDWEQWFDREKMASWIQNHGFRVHVLDRIDHGGISGNDALFLAWIGEKNPTASLPSDSLSTEASPCA
ncbi:class I SAM-dependent methyltransferase [Prosthecobacter dejongeii]|uniref:SAM-dependent methyltransferase n=1 Tax=Prosthecobacter dejongeii TaxID=48465 RepID=A0A7W7YIA2_9BACT|nr:class I SAM-dependent methyltransferase [Prosthecobacter dejongeii]MBB5036688.1 SAM-dependent methyltransferase [Prosthecobacter dejongeii]